MSFFGILFISLHSVVCALCAHVVPIGAVSVQLGEVNWALIHR